MTNIHNKGNSSNNGATKVKFGLFMGASVVNTMELILWRYLSYWLYRVLFLLELKQLIVPTIFIYGGSARACMTCIFDGTLVTAQAIQKRNRQKV